MNVRVCIQFKPPTEEDREWMHSMALSLTNSPKSIHLYAGEDPRWLIVDFTMPTEPQYKAVPKIDYQIGHFAGNYSDSAISFPRTEAERDRVARKTAHRQARRIALKAAMAERPADPA